MATPYLPKTKAETEKMIEQLEADLSLIGDTGVATLCRAWIVELKEKLAKFEAGD